MAYLGRSVDDINREKAMKALSEFLRPEFLGRVDEIAVFNSLTVEDYEKISALDNVDSVVENDILVDNIETFTDEKEFWYSGTALLFEAVLPL